MTFSDDVALINKYINGREVRDSMNQNSQKYDSCRKKHVSCIEHFRRKDL